MSSRRRGERSVWSPRIDAEAEMNDLMTKLQQLLPDSSTSTSRPGDYTKHDPGRNWNV
ncbi:hypothetical protein M569_11640 [Genlisea aurea]|uniref:Uncharacterized protein n=1 Tax=Genlisea aurea TaxID=192259 RepID=S8DJT8_9LAMI|nr:hypothetical protein M569_11640 [Genlisea aurea]